MRPWPEAQGRHATKNATRFQAWKLLQWRMDGRRSTTKDDDDDDDDDDDEEEEEEEEE